MATPIIKVSGVGIQTVTVLAKSGYRYAEDLAAAKEEALMGLRGFGLSRARKVIQAARELCGAEATSPATPDAKKKSTKDKPKNKKDKKAKKVKKGTKKSKKEKKKNKKKKKK